MIIGKGQKIKLKDITDLSAITVEVSIEMSQGLADVTCFGVDEKGQLSDDRYFIFYNQLSSPNMEIQMKTDAKSTTFQIQLDKLSATIKKLVFTATNDQELSMRSVQRGAINLYAGGQLIVQSEFNGSQFEQEKAIIMLEVYMKDGLWRLASVMSGFNGGLSALLAHFGGEEASPSSEEKKPDPVKPPVSVPPAVSGKVPVNSPAPAPIPSTSPAAAPVSIKKQTVSLKKTGDTHKISLKKNNNRLHVNLNWSRSTGFFKASKIDLDLACLYVLRDGTRGIVQALGNAFGSETMPPYIRLDMDDRTGNSVNGENMFFAKPEMIEKAVVFAYIYSGTPNWRSTDGRIVIHQADEGDIEIALDKSSSNKRFCVIASLRNVNGNLEISREERYFNGHREVDNFYGFGLRWQAGSK